MMSKVFKKPWRERLHKMVTSSNREFTKLLKKERTIGLLHRLLTCHVDLLNSEHLNIIIKKHNNHVNSRITYNFLNKVDDIGISMLVSFMLEDLYHYSRLHLLSKASLLDIDSIMLSSITVCDKVSLLTYSNYCDKYRQFLIDNVVFGFFYDYNRIIDIFNINELIVMKGEISIFATNKEWSFIDDRIALLTLEDL